MITFCCLLYKRHQLVIQAVRYSSSDHPGLSMNCHWKVSDLASFFLDMSQWRLQFPLVCQSLSWQTSVSYECRKIHDNHSWFSYIINVEHITCCIMVTHRMKYLWDELLLLSKFSAMFGVSISHSVYSCAYVSAAEIEKRGSFCRVERGKLKKIGRISKTFCQWW